MNEPLAAPSLPPYFAVIFTSIRTAVDPAGYEAMAARMLDLAARQPGYLGVESVRGDDGLGITVSYWRDLDSIEQWRHNAEHLTAQQLGRAKWYRQYQLRICRVERDHALDCACSE
jgi:heme-degrading monooxygenase HmoA